MVPSWDGWGDLAPDGYVGGPWALAFALANLLVPLTVATLLYVAAKRTHRRADSARAVEQGAGAPLVEGQQQTICGIVEIPVDSETAPGPAVSVMVHQCGTESVSKNKWTTEWRETRRETRVRPFVLVTDTGSRVPCGPDANTKLLDKLDTVDRTAHAARVRRAELTSGERAYVSGRVSSALGGRGGQGYRDAGKELVMAPGPGGMLISTVGLQAPLRAAAASRRNWALFLLVMILLAQLHVVRFHVSMWLGHVEPATVVDAGSHLVKTKNGRTRVFTIAYKLASEAQSRSAEIARADAPKLTPGRVIPVRVAPLSTTIGTEPSENLWFFLFPALLLCGSIALSFFGLAISRPWYAQKIVVDSRPGRLGADLPEELRRAA